MKMIQNKSKTLPLVTSSVVERHETEPVAVDVNMQQVIKEQHLISKDVVMKMLNAEIKRHQKIERGEEKENTITYSASDALKAFKEQIRNLN